MNLFNDLKVEKNYSPDKTVKENKIVKDFDELFDKLNIKDGSSLSFHHHLRNGDYVLNMVMEEVHKRGIKDITLVASSIFPCNTPLIPMIEDGTITNIVASYMSGDVAKAISEAKAGKIEYRLDKSNIIHCPIGKASFGKEKLEQNFNTLMDAIVKAKPAAAKGAYLKSCTVSSTMGPGVKVSTAKYGV